MAWWILIIGFVVGVIVLAVVGLSVGGRLRPLRLAVDRSMVLAEQAQGMQANIEALQDRIQVLEVQVEAATQQRAHDSVHSQRPNGV